MAALNHGAKIDLGGPAITLVHKDQQDKGSPFQLAMGTASECAPKKGVNVSNGQGYAGFGYSPGTPVENEHKYPGYPVPAKS